MAISPRKLSQQGCLFCGGKLHRADYDRKPAGEGRNGTGVTVSVATKEDAGGGRPRPRCVFWGGGFMRASSSCWSRPWSTV